MSNYLVTGGAGFIGSHIVRALLAQGSKVRVLDNYSTGKKENLAGLFGKLEILEGDIRNSSDVRRAIQGVDVIFHEAAFISVPQSLQEPRECLAINIQGTVTLLEEARRVGVSRVVLASSAAVYGNSNDLPLTENSVSPPLSPYAASKRVKEIFAELYSQAFNLDVIALRYFNVYGPRQSPDSEYAAAIPIFIRQLLTGKPITVFGDGGQSRDLIYVGDVVRANLMAAECSQAAGGIFNICTGQETRWLDLLEVLLDIFPSAPPPVFAESRTGDIYRSVGNPERAAQTFGFHALTTLETGITQTVEWMKR